MTMMSSDFPHMVMLREGGRACYEKGGLADAAQAVSDAGRMGDDYIIHVNGDELQELIAQWGEPTVNPETGMPEFFLKSIRDFFGENPWLGYALPIATGVLAPGLGGSIGGGISEGLGLGLSEGAQGAIGNGLLGAGLGYLTGGGNGALMGGLLGAGTGYLTAGSNGLFGGSGSNQITGSSGSDSLAPGSGSGASSGGSSSGGGFLSGAGSMLTKALPLMAIAGAVGGMGGSKKEPNTVEMTPEHRQAQDRMTRPLSQVQFVRKRTAMPSDADLQNYGRSGTKEYSFYRNNRIPDMPEYAQGGGVQFVENDNGGKRNKLRPDEQQWRDLNMPLRIELNKPNYKKAPANTNDRGPFLIGQAYAGGGDVGPGLDMVANHKPSRYVEGPGTGRSDDIPAMLSNNEYVFDAETVAMLGDGSPEAGAKALDNMRENIRRHKGAALAKGKISPDAKPALAYLGGH